MPIYQCPNCSRTFDHLVSVCDNCGTRFGGIKEVDHLAPDRTRVPKALGVLLGVGFWLLVIAGVWYAFHAGWFNTFSWAWLYGPALIIVVLILEGYFVADKPKNAIPLCAFACFLVLHLLGHTIGHDVQQPATLTFWLLGIALVLTGFVALAAWMSYK